MPRRIEMRVARGILFYLWAVAASFLSVLSLDGCYASRGQSDRLPSDGADDIQPVDDGNVDTDAADTFYSDMDAGDDPDLEAEWSIDIPSDDMSQHDDGDRPVPDRTWIVRVESSETVVASSILESRDGTFVTAGTIVPTEWSVYNALVIKLGGSGDMLWQKSLYDDVSSSWSSIIESSDGYLYAAGMTEPEDYDYGVMISKLDGFGNFIWHRGFEYGNMDAAHGLIECSDGNLVIFGDTGVALNPLVLKVRSDGILLWSKILANPVGWDDWVRLFVSAVETSDGGIVVVRGVETPSVETLESWVVNLDASGNVLWQKTIGGGRSDVAAAAMAGSDGNLVIAGGTNSFAGGDYDGWIVKLDGGGDILWQETVGGDSEDWIYSVAESRDGGLVAAGYTESFGAGSYDMWVMKLRGSGEIVWQKTIGGPGYDIAYSVIESRDGGIVLAGDCCADELESGGYDILIAKLGGGGEFMGPCGLMGDASASLRDSRAAVRDVSYPLVEADVTQYAPVFSPSDSHEPSSIVCPE
jgi:hypothetical protein